MNYRVSEKLELVQDNGSIQDEISLVSGREPKMCPRVNDLRNNFAQSVPLDFLHQKWPD